MNRVYRLIRDAKESSAYRGHALTRFVHAEDGNSARAHCRRCGAVAVVNPSPLPNGIDVHGEAVAVHCSAPKSVPEVARAILSDLRELGITDRSAGVELADLADAAMLWHSLLKEALET